VIRHIVGRGGAEEEEEEKGNTGWIGAAKINQVAV
jgi:hypothetical protein